MLLMLQLKSVRSKYSFSWVRSAAVAALTQKNGGVKLLCTSDFAPSLSSVSAFPLLGREPQTQVSGIYQVRSAPS